MLFFCPNSLCFIPQIQPVMLGLCPTVPDYADCIPKVAQVKRRKMPKKNPQYPENGQNFLKTPKIPRKCLLICL